MSAKILSFPKGTAMTLDWGVAQIVDIGELPNVIKMITEREGGTIYSIFPHVNALKMPIVAIVFNRIHVDPPVVQLVQPEPPA